MKKNILKFIVSVLFIISLFSIFDFESFAFSDTDYSRCFNVAEEYMLDNDYTYYDYVIADDGEYINLVFLINENYRFYVSNFGNTLYDACNYYLIFTFDSSLNLLNDIPFTNNDSTCYAHFPASAIVYSSFDILYANNSIYFEKKEFNINDVDFKIIVSNSEYTYNPIVAYTNYFPIEYINKYEVYVSTDLESWEKLYISTGDGEMDFRFQYKIFENGVYYFKFLDLETEDSEYITLNVLNILEDIVEDNTNNVPMVHIKYKKCSRNNEDLFHIYSQDFSLSDIKRYDCYYIKNHFTENYWAWDVMDLSSFNDIENGETTYQFYFHTPFDSENCTYYFVLYDNETGEFGNYTTLNCNFDYMRMYVNGNTEDFELSPETNPDYVEENKTIGFYRQTNTYKFFKNNFGLLFFPVDMMFEFFERLSLIKEESPMITIPTVYEPFTGGVLIKGFIFNLNDVLVNETLSNIYSIYLVFVDFIVYGLFFVFVYKIFKDFASFGGGL